MFISCFSLTRCVCVPLMLAQTCYSAPLPQRLQNQQHGQPPRLCASATALAKPSQLPRTLNHSTAAPQAQRSQAASIDLGVAAPAAVHSSTSGPPTAVAHLGALPAVPKSPASFSSSMCVPAGTGDAGNAGKMCQPAKDGRAGSEVQSCLTSTQTPTPNPQLPEMVPKRTLFKRPSFIMQVCSVHRVL